MGPLQAALAAISVLAAAPYEVMRPGDAALACPALTAEINSLVTEVAALDAEAKKKADRAKTGKAVGKGLLNGLANNAGGLMSGFGGKNGALIGLLASSAASGVAQQASEPADTRAEAERPASPQAQRLAHLRDINGKRGC